MSDSIKKHKVIKIGKNSYLKRLARRKLRKNDAVANFANYKRHFDEEDNPDFDIYKFKEACCYSNIRR